MSLAYTRNRKDKGKGGSRQRRRIIPANASNNDHASNPIHSQVPSNFTGQPGPFHQASGFILNNPTIITNQYQHVDESRIMKILEKYAVASADFNSAERDPPPSCHPGTRVAIRQKLLEWVWTLTAGRTHFMWLRGPAGVGKSAIVQSIAESLFLTSGTCPPGACFFFWRLDSTKNRSNPRRLLITIAYQLQLRCPPYRQYLLSELARDPQCPERAMKAQFDLFIIKPFAEMNLYSGDQPITILLDGLDECEGKREQCLIIQLISSFVTKYPHAPLLWLVSSRPEAHLEATFIRPEILPSYEIEEVEINSDEANRDVERYLRDEFKRILFNYQSRLMPSDLKPSWPTQDQFNKLTGAANGLFAYANTVIQFIDSDDRHPALSLNLIIGVIDQNPATSRGQRNPFAAMDSLYSFIMSTIPKDILPITKKILGLIIGSWTEEEIKYYVAINLLGISSYEAVTALDKLNSVLHEYDEEDGNLQRVQHKSFADFLRDETRSGPYHISQQDIDDVKMHAIHRIMNDTLEDRVGVNVDNIRLTFLDDEEDENLAIKVKMLRDSFQHLVNEKLYTSNTYYHIFDKFARACNFSDFLGMDVDPTFQYDLISNLGTMLLEIKKRDPSIDHIQELPLGALNLQKIDISKPALLSMIGTTNEISECDEFYDDMLLDHRTWYDRFKVDCTLCGDYNSPMSLFFEIFAKKMKHSPNTIVQVLGYGDRCCVILDDESLRIGNRQMNEVTMFNIILPYINDSPVAL